MDIELREILDKVYANEMKPDEAQWKICVLFNVSDAVCANCKPVSGFYLGTTCPKCNRPFRSIKKTER